MFVLKNFCSALAAFVLAVLFVSTAMANDLQCLELFSHHDELVLNGAGRGPIAARQSVASNAAAVFQELMTGPLNPPQELWTPVMAAFPQRQGSAIPIPQFGARIESSSLKYTYADIFRRLHNFSTDPGRIKRAVEMARRYPRRLDDYYEIYPGRRGWTYNEIFENGVEVMMLVASGNKGTNLIFMKTSYLPHKVLSTFDLWEEFIARARKTFQENSEEFVKLSYHHNHTDPQPLSPADYDLALAIADRFEVMTEIFAYTQWKDRTFVFVSPLTPPGGIGLMGSG